MKSIFLICFSIVTHALYSQENKWQWWNEVHGWEQGDPGWRNWMILSPGYLGPNALPVPGMEKGVIAETGEIGSTISRHFNPGDPCQDISFSFRLPFFYGKVAVETYGVLVENYGYTQQIRDERFSRDEDGTGFTQGDFYFATLVQISKDRRFPNTVLRIACKTASGHAFAARYTDTPGYFLDISSSKDIEMSHRRIFRPYMMAGFYSWQTYDEATPQNDALLYGAGMDLLNGNWSLTGNFSGYSGYHKNRDKPQVITVETRYDWHFTAAKIQFLYGLRDWDYKTFRFSFIWKFDGV